MQCPQCGAPVVLEETECIIQCRFCRTSNIMHTNPYPCYYMEPGQKKYAGLPIAYVPYWRFKGLEFSLGRKQPGFRVIDRSYLAVNEKGLPVSLGLRSQTQKLKFVQKGISGSFLAPAITRKEMLKRIAGGGEKKVHIGEVLSMVFMPFYRDKEIMYDGFSGKAAAMHPSNLPAGKKSPAYHLEFIPSLCPDCGWDLKGETDSLVLHCSNCMSFWLIHNKRLNRCKAMFYDTGHDTDMQIPFWRLQIEFHMLECTTYAHLIKLANIPKVIRKEHEKQQLYFYVPAFKINPKLFLRTGKQVTLAQVKPASIRKIPDSRFHPADLPLEEGFQAVAPMLMGLSTQKKETWDILAKEKLKLKSFSLMYIPFRMFGSEYIQDTLGFSIPRNSLKFGQQL